ncbi:hypothetical protein M5K25_021225 [Dendrobium thyrsiflorum]|uniref:Retrotransposon gag domain-containing protein n=1 Tax=Dendrobium thyrsiflorum TaxID=117978 RepID=A0ABD0UCJ3_DENTH
MSDLNVRWLVEYSTEKHYQLSCVKTFAELKAPFVKRFTSTIEKTTIADLALEKRKRDELVIKYITRWYNLKEYVVQLLKENIVDKMLPFLCMTSITTFHDLSIGMELHNTPLTIQLGQGASIQLANVVDNTKNIGFGGLKFSAAIVKDAVIPVYNMESKGSARKPHSTEATARHTVPARDSHYEESRSWAKHILVTANPTALPSEPVALGRHNVEASSYGGKLTRRQRRKKNTELRAQQPLPIHPSTLSARELKASVPT